MRSVCCRLTPQVLFDVHDYRPEEVSVKMDTHKIMVTARHEAKQGGSSVSREYSRQVRIPSDIDPMTLQCTMGPDGILAVEAPIPAPSYAAVQDSATTLPIKTASPGSSSSSPASSSAATSAGTAAAATAGPGAAAGTASAAAAGAPLQQQSSSTASSSYQTYQQAQQLPQRGGSGNLGPEPVLPAGFKPVSAPFQNSTPPPPSQGSAASLGTSSSSSSSQHHQHLQQQPQQQQQQQQPSQKVSSSTVSSSQSSFLDNSGLLSGFPKMSPPFQPLSAGQPPAPGFSPPMPSGVVGGGRIGSPVVSSETGKFKLEIDIEDFRPEELTVKTQDKRVVVCARREEKSGTRSSTRELSREHTIPDSVDPLTIKAFFTDGGKLIIEAPYREAGMQSQVTGR